MGNCLLNGVYFCAIDGMTLGSTCDSPMAAFHKLYIRCTEGSVGLYESYGPSGKAVTPQPGPVQVSLKAGSLMRQSVNGQSGIPSWGMCCLQNSIKKICVSFFMVRETRCNNLYFTLISNLRSLH